MTFSVIRVNFLSATHQYPCDVEETSVSTGQIECYTRAMPAGVYTPHVILCSSADACRDVPCVGEGCTFETKTHYTPYIKSVTPIAGYPGTLLTVYGKIITSLYGSERAETAGGRTETIKRCYLDGAGQTCELRDSNGDMYGIEMDDEGTSKWGTFKAVPQGKFVGHQNISIIVSDKYGRSEGTWEAKRVSANMKMYNFQTYAKVSSVSPRVGSTMGGSTISISGDWFDPTSQVASVTVGGEECSRHGDVTDIEIVCLAPKDPANQAVSYAGNRGVYREVWEYSEPASMPALTDLPVGDPTEGPAWTDGFFWTNRSESYFSRMRGFFIPPNDNDYQFVLQDCKKPSDDFILYFSPNGAEDETLDIFECPDSGRRWSERYTLSGSKRYYMEVRYRHEWTNHTQQDRGVAMKMFNTDYAGGQNYHAQSEKQEIKITSTIIREKQRISLGSDVQDFTLQYGGVQSEPIQAGSSPRQVRRTMEQMFQTLCPGEVANPNQAIRQFAEDYEGDPRRSETGSRVEADETEPFCGRKSLKNPSHLYKSNPDHNLYGIDPNMDKVVCFAYKGNMASRIGFRFRYDRSGEQEEETTWFGPENDTSLDFAADREWKYSCINLQALFSTLRLQASNLRIQDIQVAPAEESDDFFIDNFFIGKVEPMRPEDVANSRRLAAQLGGNIVREVEVDRCDGGYDVTFIPYNCGHSFPPMDAQVTCTGNCDVNTEQLQAASLPVQGDFYITFDGRVAAVRANATDDDLADILKLELGIDAQVDREGDCSGYKWKIEWLLDGGDKVDLEVDGTDLTGNDVKIEQSTTNHGGLWFDPIPGDMLRTRHGTPQVEVSINNIPSRCEGDCSFSWATDNTPIVTSVNPIQGQRGAEVEIVGTGFSIDCNDMRVLIGHTGDTDEGVVCEPTACTSSSIRCTVGDSGRGQHAVKVYVLPHGNDPDANPNGRAAGEVSFTYIGAVAGISPTASGVGGGVELNITGFGFAADDVPKVGGKDCDVISHSNEQILCLVPPGSPGTVDVTINGTGGAVMQAADSFTYDAGLAPVITAYFPNQSIVKGGDTLTIEGSGFGHRTSLFFRGSEEILEVAATVNGSKVTCSLPALGPGKYDILLHGDGAGYAVMDGSALFPTIEYVLRVTGMSPSRGSLSGGTVVGISGVGFSSNVEEHAVMFGDTVCEVFSSSSTEVWCRMRTAGRRHVVDNKGVHPNLGIGYAWSQSTLTIEEGDTVDWTWSPPTQGVGFAVRQTTGTDGELLPNGFSSGPKSSQGSYSYTFNTVGDFYYSSGCVDDNCDIVMRGKVEVVKAVDHTEILSFKLNGMEAIYDPTGSEPALEETCPGSTSEVLGCSEDQSITSSSSQFSFVFRDCLTATVASISPTRGTAGQTVTIQGTGFGTSTCENEVLIGGYSCNVTSSTSNNITCVVNPGSNMPVGTFLPVSVNIKNRGYARMAIPGGEKSRMFALMPKITSIFPEQGSVEGGTQLTISGSGFTSPADSTTSAVGTVPCYIQSLSYNQIICVTQAASERTREVTVSQLVNGYRIDSVCDGRDNSGCQYAYRNSQTPRVSTIDPRASGSPTVFTVGGSLFGTSVDDITVSFGEKTSCVVTSVTDDVISCTAGHIPVGDQPVRVHVAGRGNAASSAVVTGQAVINTMSPTQGSLAGGTTLTITGNGFDSDTEVTLNEKICEVVFVNLTTVTCITPAATNETDPLVQVSVVSNGQAYPPQDFTYSSTLTPSVSGISPAVATSGTSVTITGSGFGQTTGDNEVSIDGAPCVVDTSSDTEIICTLGDHVAGSNYAVDVTVVEKGTARSAVTFSYELSLSAVMPTTGSFGGGRNLTLMGTGFSENATVAVCGRPCPVNSVAPNWIFCELPAHDGLASGTVVCDVAIVVGKETRTLSNAFSYDSSLTPIIDSVSPALGGTAGGTTVTITGTNLRGIRSVTIAGSDCVISGVPSETEVVCVTEAHSGSVRAKLRAEGMDGIATQGNADFYYVDRWSSVYTWGGEGLPEEGDFVIVHAGQTLLLDTDTPILRMLLIQGGTLLFHDERNVHLQSEYILITDGGTLQVGTEEAPFQHQATITLHGNLRSKELPIYGAKVLGVRQGTLDLHGSPVPVTWTRLAQTAAPGATTLVLEQPVTWKAGDSIAIATTGYRHSQAETEVRQIASVAADGVTITITEPLDYEHISVEETFANGKVRLETRGEVALLTRNVVIRGSDDPSWHDQIEACEEGFDTGEFVTQTCFQGRFGEEVGSDQFGGHVLIHQREPNAGLVKARIEHVEFTYVGQAFRLGRYPIHSHLNGDMSNSYVRGNAIHRSFNRAVTMHGTHNLLVERNVVFNIMGGAFFIEDGIETGNIIQYNLALFVKASTSLLNDDITPAGYWVTNPNNTIRHNHAAGGTHFGFWYRMHKHPDGASYDPNICPQRVPLGVFQNNTVHSQGWFGLWVFQEYYPAEGGSCSWGAKPQPAVFRGLTAWRNEKGAEWVNVGAVQFEDFVLANNEKAGIETKRILRISDWGLAKITNVTLIGHSQISTNIECSTAGLVLPFARYLTITGAKMINYDRAGCAAFHVTSIDGTCTELCAGFQYRAEAVEYYSTPNKAAFRWEHEGWIEDLDGSVTGTVGGKVIPSSATLPPTCVENAEFSKGSYPGSVCTDAGIRFYRFGFKGVQPESLDMRNAILTNEYGNTSVPWSMKRMTHKPGWMLILVGKTPYTFSFKDSSHITNLTYSGTFYEMEDTDYIIMQHKFTQRPDSFSLAEGDDREESVAAISYANNDDKDWYFDEAKTFSYIVSGKGESSPVDRSVKMQVYRCFYEDCIPPADPNDVPPDRQRPDDYIMYSTLSWKMDTDGFMVPSSSVPDTRSITLQQDDDVKVMGVSWLVLGDADVPKLGKLYIYTVLELWDPSNPYTRDYTLEASHIFIQGGRLVVGWEDNPYLGNIHIILHGDHNTPEMPVPNGPTVGAKAIGVFGGLDLFGKSRNVCWTQLAQTAAAGANTITLADAVDWQVDEEIVITTTSFDAWETETFKITGVSADGRTLTLNSSLAYEHIYHSDTVDGKSYTMAAEVGLLTRNIKIEGADYQGLFTESFGARVLVGSFNTGGQTYTGYARIRNVEFYHTGQEGWNAFYDPRFSLAFVNTGDVSEAKPSKVENSAFHNGFSPAIGVYGTNELEIINNVVHHTVGQGMIIEGSRNTLIGNLIALSIWPGAYQDRKEENSEKWEAALEIMDATYIVLKDNVIAGAERIGLHLDGEPCPGADNPVDSWSGNVIHSALHGAHLYEDGLPVCSMVSNFLIYKCYSYGVYFQSVSSAVLKDVTSIDNGIGSFTSIIGPPSLSHQGKNKSVLIQDSLFVGRSASFSCEDDVLDLRDDNIEIAQALGGLGFPSEKGTAGGHIGVSFPGFISAFSASPHHPWDSQMDYPAKRGITRIKGVTFSNFGEACGGLQDVALHTWNSNEDGMHPIETEGLSFVDVDENNIAFFGRPSLRKINPADCVDMECDGKKETLIKDSDGSLLGSPGALIPQAEWEWDGDPRRGLGDYRIPKTMLADLDGRQRNISEVVYGGRGIIRTPQCVNNDELHGHLCHDLNYEMLVIESLDDDTETRRLSPVALLADGYIDLLNGPQDHGWCAGYTCQKRISTFWAVVATEKEYLIHFSGLSPQNLQLQLLNTAPDKSLVVGIYYCRPERLDVYVDGSFVEPKNFDPDTGGIVAGKHHPTLSDSPGANFMDIEWQTLYFTLSGSTPVTIKQTDVIVLTFGMPPVTVEDFFSSDQLVTNLCLFLNIPPEKVRVMNVVREDSLRRRRAAYGMTVEIQIGDPPTLFLNESADNSLSYDDLIGLTAMMVNAAQAGELDSVFGTNVTSVSVVDPVPPVGSQQWREMTVEQTGADDYPMPGSIIVHTQPVPLHEMAVFTVQPRIQALDAGGNHMLHLGHTSSPWEVTASLQLGDNSDPRAALSGTLSVPYVNGWANFTDLTVSHSGEDYTILFTVEQRTRTDLAVQSEAFTVTTIPVRAAMLSQPETATVNEAFNLQLELRDAVTGQALTDISWKGQTWTVSVSLMEPVQGLYQGSLRGNTSATFDVVTGHATFRDISLTHASRYHLQFHVTGGTRDPPVPEYDFTFSPAPIDVFEPGFQMPSGVSKSVQITFDADFYQTVGDHELYFETFMMNVLNTNFSTVYFTAANAYAGSVIVDMTVTGPGDEVEAAVLRLWYQVQQPMKVMFNGNTMETIGIMYVDGQRYYGTEAVSAGPDVVMIAAVSSVAVLLLVTTVFIVVWLKKRKSRKVGGTLPGMAEEKREGTNIGRDFSPTSALGLNKALPTVHEMKDLEASVGKGNAVFTMQETAFDKTDVQSRPLSRASISPRPVSPPGYVCEEGDDIPELRNVAVKQLDKLYRHGEMAKTWLDMKKPLNQVREDLVAAFPARLGWQDFVFLTTGLTHVAMETENKLRLKDIVEVGEDVVTIHMV
ncbi:fibrocystin-L-like isoform X2 [Branchiostoma floridae x Branchiostoma belcheri]